MSILGIAYNNFKSNIRTYLAFFISRVFDKGFTGKNGRNQLYKSTGMGMYFVKKMIDSLGHEIEVCSENGSYTIFNIYFYDISDYLSLDS